MDIKKENVAFENSVAFIPFTGILRYVEFTGDVYQLRRDISTDEFREIEQWYWALQSSWKAWQAAKAQADEKIEALQNAVIFADECRKEWHESYMKLRKDKAALENSIEVNNMWIKDKSVKPEIDSLVVIAVLIDADVFDYRVARFSKVISGGVDVGMFEVWDELGTILAIEEIEAYMPLQEYDRRKGL